MGSLFGIILANKIGMVQAVYEPTNYKHFECNDVNDGDLNREEPTQDENKIFNKALILKIFGWWLATVPVAIVVSIICTEATILIA